MISLFSSALLLVTTTKRGRRHRAAPAVPTQPGMFQSSSTGTQSIYLPTPLGFPPKCCMEAWEGADQLSVWLEKHIDNVQSKSRHLCSSPRPGKQLKCLLKTKVQCSYDTPILIQHLLRGKTNLSLYPPHMCSFSCLPLCNLDRILCSHNTNLNFSKS